MPIAFKCNKCSSKYNVKDELAGKKTKCPKCSTILRIPTPGAKKPAAAKPPAPPKAADPFVDDDPLGLGLPSSEPGNDIFKSDAATPGNSAPAAAPADDGFWSQSSGPRTKESNDPLAETPLSLKSSTSDLPSVGSYIPTSGKRGGNVTDAKRQLFWPVLIVRISVLLGLAGSGGLLLFITGLTIYFGRIAPQGIVMLISFGVLFVILCTAYSGLNKPIKLENKAMAWIGFLFAMPFGFALPFAIWGMVVLSKDEVSRSFRN